MSFAELEEQVAELPTGGRMRHSAFLAELNERGEADSRNEVDGQMKAMGAGEKVSADQFEQQHRKRNTKVADLAEPLPPVC